MQRKIQLVIIILYGSPLYFPFFCSEKICKICMKVREFFFSGKLYEPCQPKNQRTDVCAPNLWFPQTKGGSYYVMQTQHLTITCTLTFFFSYIQSRIRNQTFTSNSHRNSCLEEDYCYRLFIDFKVKIKVCSSLSVLFTILFTSVANSEAVNIIAQRPKHNQNQEIFYWNRDNFYLIHVFFISM